ncbi:CBS domain-containing protein [uncultured Pelagimonas sp.]|uniref:CBS domain-containing protein n=1 Tax=uncultured Pelagimonas sp. TaxID=1618102 RepID=UPI002639619A|nr:CBS domain-containing protein [uncultured Pelagimonas sp.]
MVGSYKPKTRGDANEATHSQSLETNVSVAQASVAEVMSDKGGELFGIGPQNAVSEAVAILAEKRIGALVVTDDDGKLVGILSERDIVRRLAETPGQTLPQKVDQLMSAKVETTTPDELLVSVLRRMTDGRFRHMPVLKDGQLLGMISIGDVVNHRLKTLEYEALKLKQLIVG